MAIPVHAGETMLARALSCYRELSTRFPQAHDVVLLINASPATLSRTAFDVRRHVLEAEVQEARRRVPGLNISVLRHHFETSINIGRVRGLLSDSLVASARRSNLEDPILISHDADQMALAKHYFQRLENAFARDRRLDAVAGAWCHGYGPKGENYLPIDELLPELFLHSKFTKVLNDLNEERARHRSCLGSNVTVRLSSLCAAGGWDYAFSCGEDYELAMRITAMRLGHQAYGRRRRAFRYDPSLYVVTSPRRLLKWLLTKGHERRAEAWKTAAGTFDSDSEVKQYLRNRRLLQTTDIVRAMGGDLGAMRKIRERVLLVAYAIRMDEHPDIRRLARRFGIHGRLVHRDSYSTFEVDWDKSGIIDELFRWVRVTSRHSSTLESE